ncbi:hypothetical protein A2U01_0027400, partial [Trifolium medium]|nr:hypothetical protein [Trifolium medium]
MKDVKKWQRMRAILEKRVASRPPKPVEVVSDKSRHPSSKSKRRTAGAITFKTPVERKRDTSVVPVGKGKTMLVEDDIPSSRKKVVKNLGEGLLAALRPSGRLVEVL